MPSFKKMKKSILDLGAQDTGGDAEDMVGSAINYVYRRIRRMNGAENSEREFSLTTNTSSSKYGMPVYVNEILKITDPTNDRDIKEMTSQQYKTELPGNDDTGDPEWYFQIGTFGVEVQPSSTGVLTVESSSALDASSTYVTVFGTNSADIRISEDVTMNGTTAVPTTNSFKTVERIVKSEDDGTSWVGYVTVKDVGGNSLAVIPSYMESPTYRWIEFYPKPSVAITYTVQTYSETPELINDNDWPEIDDDFHDLIEIGAKIITFPSFGKGDQVPILESMFRTRMEEYKSIINPSKNLIHHMADVSMGEQLPLRPWIPGVDRGLVSS